MPCNLVIQSASYGYCSGSGDTFTSVTPAVSNLLANQYQANQNLQTFSFSLTASAVGQLAPPAGVTPALTLTFYWQESGQSWTCTTSWAVGQIVSIPVVTPPKIVSAIYSSPNVSLDVTSRFQAFIILKTGPQFRFQVGSFDFLRSLFGTVNVNGTALTVDPDSGVTKSLYVKFSVIVSGQANETSIIATDFQSVLLT